MMLNLDRCPAAEEGCHWEISSEYPVGLSPSNYAGANIFGVLPVAVEHVYDHNSAHNIVRDQSLIEPVLSILYRSTPDYWLAKVSWRESTKLVIAAPKAVQKFIALALIPEDMKFYFAGAVGLKALLKLPSKDDVMYKVVGIQVKDAQTLTSLVKT